MELIKDPAREYRTVKEYVTHVLTNDERARNDDKWLILRVLREMGFNIFIPFNEFKDMPSFETIRRVRQKLQQDGFFQANDEIKGHRIERENFYKCEMSSDDSGQRRFII